MRRGGEIAVVFAVGTVLGGAVLALHSRGEASADSGSWYLKMTALPLHKQAAFWSGLLFLVAYAFWGFKAIGHKVLLLDFHTFQVPESCKMSRKAFLEGLKHGKGLAPETIELHERIIENIGIGNATGMPEGLGLRGDGPIAQTLNEKLAETNMIIYDVAEKAMQKAGVSASEIDVVIAASSAFAPTPSLAAMLVNRFRMRSHVLTYNLSGMGCSAAVACVDTAKHLLAALPDSVVLIVCHENVTANWYPGDEPAMVATNCLFRLNGAAAVMSNRLMDYGRAKYELVATQRTHLGAANDAYGSIVGAADASHKQGLSMQKNVLDIIGRAVKTNVAALAPKVLSYRELARSVFDKAYTPDFRRSFDHFLLHTGSLNVINDLEFNLKLTRKQTAPSKDALHRFGNTSCASTWYTLAGIEHRSVVRRGERVWQLAFGSGFKCGSAVWKARRNNRQEHSSWM